jgi:hypothetical protein
VEHHNRLFQDERSAEQLGAGDAGLRLPVYRGSVAQRA